MRLVAAGTLAKSSQAQAIAGGIKLSAVGLGATGVTALCRHDHLLTPDRVGHRVQALSFDANFAGHLLEDAAADQP